MAVETLGALADDGHTFIREIGRRAALCTADPRETTFLHQRFSIAIQRFNSICLANSFSISVIQRNTNGYHPAWFVLPKYRRRPKSVIEAGL